MAKRNNKLWFKAKMYGWGWRPVTWQGWIITLLYAALLVKFWVLIDARSHSVSDTFANFAVYFILITFLFLVICYNKGERPRWRWGR